MTKPRWSSVRRVSSVLATAALTAGLAAPIAHAEPAQPDKPLEWGPCPVAAFTDKTSQCAEFQAPMDYSNPDGPQITLMMSKIPATGQSRGVIAGNNGGPGGSALGMFTGPENLPGNITLPEGVREHYDLVAVQPRGHKWSTMLTCGFKDKDVLVNEYLGTPGDVYRKCEREQPGYIKTITTENTARDLDVARQALGLDKISVYGLSYGTALMSTYVTLFPEHTDKTILDSSFDPDLLWFGLGPAREPFRVDAMNNLFRWLADHDAEYHLGTTALDTYKAWYRRINENSGALAAPLTPPPLTEADIPVGSSVGELALGTINQVIDAGWWTANLHDAPRMWHNILDEDADTHLEQAWTELVTGRALYHQPSCPLSAPPSATASFRKTRGRRSTRNASTP